MKKKITQSVRMHGIVWRGASKGGKRTVGPGGRDPPRSSRTSSRTVFLVGFYVISEVFALESQKPVHSVSRFPFATSNRGLIGDLILGSGGCWLKT